MSSFGTEDIMQSEDVSGRIETWTRLCVSLCVCYVIVCVCVLLVCVCYVSVCLSV